jgi:hypothetical protein
MRATIVNRMVVAIGISAALVGSAMTASAEPPQDKNHHDQKDHKQQPPTPQRGHQQQQQPAPQAQQHARSQPQQAYHPPPPQQPQNHGAPPVVRQNPTPPPHQEAVRTHGQGQRMQEQRAQIQHVPQQQVRATPESQRIHMAPQQQPLRVAPQQQRVHIAPQQQVRIAPQAPQVRLAPQQQQVLISQQQRRLTQYRDVLNRDQRFAEQQSSGLQYQRPAQYRFMQGYLGRLRQQEFALRDERSYNYWSDPYFYTPAEYRYSWDGQYYETNRYGVALLRQALNAGYREGRLAGMADRYDGWRPNYRSCYAYRDANYGYDGYYLDRGTYNYYFREGFRRGYEDGYYNSYRYGRYSNGSSSLLGSVLSVVLRLQPIR